MGIWNFLKLRRLYKKIEYYQEIYEINGILIKLIDKENIKEVIDIKSIEKIIIFQNLLKVLKKDGISLLLKDEFFKNKSEEILDENHIKLNEIDKLLENKKIQEEIAEIKSKLINILNNLININEEIINANKLKDNFYILKFKLQQEKQYLDRITEVIQVFSSILKEQMSKFLISRRAFISNVIFSPPVLAAISTDSISLVASLILQSKASSLKKSKDGIAILIGNTPLIGLLHGYKEAYIARVELALGYKADKIYKNATKNDFYNCLLDNSIQTIAVHAHGTFNSMTFVDGNITTIDIYKSEAAKRMKLAQGIYDNKKEKVGYLFKHGCGGNYNLDNELYNGVWGEPIFNKKRIIQWRRIVHGFEIFLNPFGRKDDYSKHLVELDEEIKKKLKIKA